MGERQEVLERPDFDAWERKHSGHLGTRTALSDCVSRSLRRCSGL